MLRASLCVAFMALMASSTAQAGGGNDRDGRGNDSRYDPPGHSSKPSNPYSGFYNEVAYGRGGNDHGRDNDRGRDKDRDDDKHKNHGHNGSHGDKPCSP